MTPVWRTIVRAGAVQLLLAVVIVSGPLALTRAELLPYVAPLAIGYLALAAGLGTWAWRCARRIDEARLAHFRSRAAASLAPPAKDREAA